MKKIIAIALLSMTFIAALPAEAKHGHGRWNNGWNNGCGNNQFFGCNNGWGNTSKWERKRLKRFRQFANSNRGNWRGRGNGWNNGFLGWF